MARIAIDWSSLWAMVKEMPIEGLRGVGQELDGDDFTHWIASRSPRTQVEVLESAPESIQQHFYSKNVIHPFTINALGIKPSKSIKLIDRRTINGW